MALADNITNAQVRDALIAMGIIPQDQWASIDITGAQNGYFKNGLMTSLGITDDQFQAAKTLARWNGQAADQGDVMKDLGKAGIQLNTSADAQTMFQRTQQIQSGQPLSVGIPGQAPPAPPGSGLPQEVTGPEESTHYIQQRGGDVAGTPGQPAKSPPTAPTTGAGGGGGGAGGGPGSSNLPPPPPPTTPDDLNNYINTHAGAFAWFNDIPEINKIIVDVASQPGTLESKQDKFEQLVTQTDWWKNTSATARHSHAQMRSDPGTWASTVADQSRFIGQLAKQEGITIDPGRLNAIANTAVTYGWTPDQVKGALAAEYHYDPTNQQQGATATFVKGTASQYLLGLSDPAIQQWTQQILSGNVSQDDFKQYLAGQAKIQMPWMAAQIDQGVNPTQFLEPTRQKLASTLDMNPNDINWTDSKWSSLLASKDPKTGQLTQNTQDQIDRAVMTDPKYGWDKTSNAVGAASGVASSILKSFGMA